MKHRYLAGALLALLLLTQASCSDTQTPSQTTANVPDQTEAVTEAVTEDPALRDNLPEADLECYNFRMLLRGDEEYQRMTYIEEQDGNIVNDAVFEKIRAVEERFNVDITSVDNHSETSDDTTAIRQLVLAGDDAFDIAQGHDVSFGNLAMEGLFLNVYDIPHLDLTKPWWPQETLESMTVADQMYLMINNISYLNLSSTSVMFFNKDLFSALDIPLPYEEVFEGKWTMDRIIEISALAYHDLNGNGERDEMDRYGITLPPWYYSWLEPFKVEPYRKDADGRLYYEVDLDRLTRVTEKFHDLMFGTGGYVADRETFGDDVFDVSMDVFTEGRALFRYAGLNDAVKYLSKSDVTYGIVPMPKLDETQDKYYSGANDRPIAVPTTAYDNLDTIGIVIEALNAEGYKRVYPAYYEIAMKNRYADRTEDAQMLDLVRDNTITAFTYLYGNYSSVYNIMLEELFNRSTPSKDVASWCAKIEKKQIKYVEKLMKFYEDNEA